VQSLHIFDGFLNYDPNINPHIHCYCTSCGNIYDIMMEGRADVVVPRTEIEGFLIDHIGVVFKGTCGRCR
jgi:Fe2+ or Zn2+ uptake regulation protein